MKPKALILEAMASWRQRIRGFSFRDHLAVRKGFLVGSLAGFSVAGSVLWSIPSVTPLITKPLPEPIIPSASFIPVSRGAIPNELGWFFHQFPYVSQTARITRKNYHAFVISDPDRHKNYVVNFGQRFRRVEIYGPGTGEAQVQVFMPGSKRTVSFDGARVISQSTVSDGNLWMWKSPLWNAQHLKIYGIADLWLNSPYKRYSCAGFVHRFLKDVNVHVPILDAWDMARLRYPRVPIEELEPGDILTFKAASDQHRRFWGQRITHVGVYVGNGKFIHAATASRKARRSWIRLADVSNFRHRIDKILRPPELL